MSEERYAPKIPRIEPTAAPINLRRLARLRRSSKRITAIANRTPTAVPLSFDRLNGRKGYPATGQKAKKISRKKNMSQNVPALLCERRERTTGLAGALS